MIIAIFYIVYIIFGLITLFIFYRQDSLNKIKFYTFFEYIGYFFMFLTYLIFFIGLFYYSVTNFYDNYVYAVGFENLLIPSVKKNAYSINNLVIFDVKGFVEGKLEMNKRYEQFNKISVDFSSILKQRYYSNQLNSLKSNTSLFFNSNVNLEIKNNMKFSSIINEQFALTKKKEEISNYSFLFIPEQLKELGKKIPYFTTSLINLVGPAFCKSWLEYGILKKHPILFNYDGETKNVMLYILTSSQNMHSCSNYSDIIKISDIKLDGKPGQQYMRIIGIRLNVELDNFEQFKNMLQTLIGNYKYNIMDYNLNYIEYIKDINCKNNIVNVIFNNNTKYLFQIGDTIFEFNKGNVKVMSCACTTNNKINDK